jgi:hypothetical protein
MCHDLQVGMFRAQNVGGFSLHRRAPENTGASRFAACSAMIGTPSIGYTLAKVCRAAAPTAINPSGT